MLRITSVSWTYSPQNTPLGKDKAKSEKSPSSASDLTLQSPEHSQAGCWPAQAPEHSNLDEHKLNKAGGRMHKQEDYNTWQGHMYDKAYRCNWH